MDGRLMSPARTTTFRTRPAELGCGAYTNNPGEKISESRAPLEMDVMVLLLRRFAGLALGQFLERRLIPSLTVDVLWHVAPFTVVIFDHGAAPVGKALRLFANTARHDRWNTSAGDYKGVSSSVSTTTRPLSNGLPASWFVLAKLSTTRSCARHRRYLPS
jgi:hypothetical protein